MTNEDDQTKTEKRCSKCCADKPLEEFSRDRSRSDGRRSRCKECACAQNRAYYAEHAEEIRARHREYNARHRAENPELVWLHRYRHRMKRYGLEPIAKPFTLAELIEKCAGVCYHCGGEWSELDHFPVPVAEGGEHSLENTVLSCQADNIQGAHGARLCRELRAERDRIIRAAEAEIASRQTWFDLGYCRAA